MCFSPRLVKGQYVPCGKCYECKMMKSNEWAYRCMLEASLYKENCMLTLTYNEDNLPNGASLKREDLQKFLKRLREALEPKKIRYFGCGEYGSKGNRPHYHIIIFGWCPDDLKFWCYDKKKTKLYRSPFIESKWKLGFSSVGELTFDSARYCAKYLQKDLAINDKRSKPFLAMSMRPGIGAEAYKLEWLFSDKIYINGKFIKTPRYFLNLTARDNPEFVEAVKEQRKINALIRYESDPYFEETKKRKKKFFDKFVELFKLEKNKKEAELKKFIDDGRRVVDELFFTNGPEVLEVDYFREMARKKGLKKND